MLQLTGQLPLAAKESATQSWAATVLRLHPIDALPRLSLRGHHLLGAGANTIQFMVSEPLAGCLLF